MCASGARPSDDLAGAAGRRADREPGGGRIASRLEARDLRLVSARRTSDGNASGSPSIPARCSSGGHWSANPCHSTIRRSFAGIRRRVVQGMRCETARRARDPDEGPPGEHVPVFGAAIGCGAGFGQRRTGGSGAAAPEVGRRRPRWGRCPHHGTGDSLSRAPPGASARPARAARPAAQIPRAGRTRVAPERAASHRGSGPRLSPRASSPGRRCCRS
jgi:hypothetical protein